MIVATSEGLRIGYNYYPQVHLREFLPALTTALTETQFTHPGLTSQLRTRLASRALDDIPKDLTFQSFFERMKSFIDTDMIVLCDTSLCLFPSAELVIKNRSGFISQCAWLSIGYTAGAALGVGIAEPTLRPVVFIGDGGFQMLAQAFSTLAHNRIGAILFVINNALFGVEQFLVEPSFYKSEEASPTSFCQIPSWNYAELPKVFGAGKGYKVQTLAELDEVLRLVKQNSQEATIVEVYIPLKDLPPENRAAIP
jgi:indolepyruvate decarboxylase